MEQNQAILYLVVPCYNEQEVLPVTAGKLTAKIDQLVKKSVISDQSRIIFVDDGSKDLTWQVITDEHGKNPVVQGYKLSRNRGHQNALLAGLLKAKEYEQVDLEEPLKSEYVILFRYHAACSLPKLKYIKMNKMKFIYSCIKNILFFCWIF